MTLTVDALAYLHDAILHSVVFDSTAPIRSISFRATFHDDCGSKELDGRSIEVIAHDITLLEATVHGAMANREEINSCELGVSERTEQSMTELIRTGVRKPRTSVTLLTHSGSVWEIMCESISLSFV